jgi:thioredoxin 1
MIKFTWAMTRSIYSALFVLCFLAGCSEAQNTDSLRMNDLPSGTEQITFVELGSVNCIPCKQMKPVMAAIEQDYAGKVKVVFHDVWTSEGKKYGSEYGIRLIPTQVFLDNEGNEVARHEGYFPKDELEALLAEQGITKS